MITWIAGWPHNGSTLCRQIIKQCFEMPTYSRYVEPELDFLFPGGEAFTKQYRAEPECRNRYYNESAAQWLIKTHEIPIDDNPAIFVIRDGRDAVTALSHFYKIPIKHAITGMGVVFGSWSAYYHAWRPRQRANTLTIRFEEMVTDPGIAAVRIGKFLRREVLEAFTDDFDDCKKQWPQLFHDRVGCWKREMSASDLDLFWRCHGDVMGELGYE